MQVKIEFAISYFRVNNMSFKDLRLKYALEGNSNYIAWKDRMEEMLKDNDLKEFLDHDIPKPLASDAKDLGE